MKVWKLQTIPNIKYDGQVYISTNHPSGAGGQLIILLNANLTHLGSKIPFEEIIDFISTVYYGYIDDMGNDDVDVESVLERTVLEFKKNILKFFSQHSKEEIAKYLTVFIGVLYKDELLFARSGDVRIFLLYKKAFMEIEEEDDTSSSRWESFLSFITRGPISENSLVFIGNSIVFDYFSDIKLQKILSKGWDESIKEYKELIAEFGRQSFFQTIIVSNIPKEAVFAGKSQKTQESVGRLNNLKDSTSSLMSASILDKVKGDLGKLSQKLKQTEKEEVYDRERAIKRRIEERDKLKKVIHFISKLLKKIFIVLVWFLSHIPQIFRIIYRNRKSIIGGLKNMFSVIYTTARGLPQKTATFYKEKTEYYRSLDERRKNIVLAIFGAVIVLIASILLGVSQVSQSKSTQQVLSVLEEVDLKRSSAEAALLYGNRKQAAVLIAEARKLLSSIDASKAGKEVKDKKAETAKSLFEIYTQIQKIEILDDINPVFSGGEVLAEDNSIIHIVGAPDISYMFTSQGEIYTMNPKEKSVSKSGVWKEKGEIKSLAYMEDGRILVQTLEPTPNLYILDTGKRQVQKVDITWNNPETPKQSVIPYFTRIYTLDARDRQIYRHQRFGERYLKGVAWLKDEAVDLSDAVSMAIDGSIWVVTSSGKVYKLTGGEREKIDLSFIDPPLNSPSFIWTNVDSNLVYIVDPATRRIVVIEKDGTLRRQYVSKKFDKLSEISVNTDLKRIFVLNGNDIYEIEEK